MCGRDGSLFYRFPFFYLFFGEFNDEDGIFRHKSHKHYKSDLEIHIAFQTDKPDAEICSGNGNRQGKDYRNRH